MRDVTAFSVGDVIKTTLTVYFSNLPAFLSLSLVMLAPSFLVVLLPESSTLNDRPIIPDFDADPVAASEAMFPYYLVAAREGSGPLAVRDLAAGNPCLWRRAPSAGRTCRHRGLACPIFGQRLVPVAVVAVVVAVVTGIGFLLFFVPGRVADARPVGRVAGGGRGTWRPARHLPKRRPDTGFPVSDLRPATDPGGGSALGGDRSWVDRICGTHRHSSDLVGLAVRGRHMMSGIYATAVSVTYHDLRVLKEGTDTRAVSSAFS